MGRPLRVLIVEDNDDDVLLLLRSLKQGGFDVSYEHVETAPSLQQMLESQVWDLIISDYNMPSFNALDALEMLHKTGKDIPFFLVSGVITEEMAVAGMRAGAHDYLMKDNLARLGPAVERELQEAVNRRHRDEAEHNLRVSDERFRATFNQAAVGLGHVALEGYWLLANQKLCDIVGYSSEELATKKFYEITHPDDRVVEMERLKRLQAGEIKTYSMEKRYIHKDGSSVWVNVTASLARDAEGRPEYFIRVVEDISERKRTELEIQALNARLARAMHLTHDRVRNNLQQLISMIEVYEYRGGVISQAQMQRLSRAVQTMAQVHELLTRKVRRDATVETLDTEEVLCELLALLQKITPERPLNVEIAALPLPVDPVNTLALITNELVGNALKHSAGAIWVAFEVLPDVAQLTVEDEGAGFPAAFDPLQCATAGLELVEDLTRLDLRGEAYYENRPEGGARIRIRFPLPSG